MIEMGKWELAFDIITRNGYESWYDDAGREEIMVFLNTNAYRYIEQSKEEFEFGLHIRIQLNGTNSNHGNSNRGNSSLMIMPQFQNVGRAIATYFSSRAFHILTKWAEEVHNHTEAIPITPFILEDDIQEMNQTPAYYTADLIQIRHGEYLGDFHTH